MKGYVKKLNEMSKSQSEKDFKENIKHEVKCPKWRKLFSSAVKAGNTFSFNLEAINYNLQFNKADALGSWNPNVRLPF